ncbi:MAG: TetR/AcrR family transcriptional regulator [Aeromonas veronii]
MIANKKYGNKKTDIINTSKKLFLNKGYNSTSMAMIIDEVGVAKGTIYHHFKSKEDILMAVVRDIINTEKHRVINFIDTCEFGCLDAGAKILMLIQLSDISRDNVEIVNALHSPQNAYMQSQMLGYYIEVFSPIYAEVITQGVRDGVFNTNHPLESAELLIGGIQFLTDTGFYHWCDNDLFRRNASIFSLIEKLLGADAGVLSSHR